MGRGEEEGKVKGGVGKGKGGERKGFSLGYFHVLVWIMDFLFLFIISLGFFVNVSFSFTLSFYVHYCFH